MPVVQRASGISCVHGGNPHSGWVPPGAAMPMPEPLRRFTLDVTIEYEPGDGFLLIWQAREDPVFAGDEWFASLSAAEEAAQAMFEISPDRWQRDRAG